MSPTERNRSSRSSARLVPPADGIAIRMYRQGLGDCFLLAFAGESRKSPSYALIDCGAHFAQAGGRDNMVRILDDIIDCTGGHVDVVVATHEHSDHLSAFKHGAHRLLNDELKIDQLWLAWTERDDDELAQQLRGERLNAKDAIDAALDRLKAELGLDPEDDLPTVDAVESEHLPSLKLSNTLEAAQQFFAIDERNDDDTVPTLARKLGLRNPDKVSGNELALAVLKDKAREVRYFRPGEVPVTIPGASAARAYVLGPPRNLSLLKKSDPSRGDRHETFLTSATGMTSFAAAAVRADENDLAALERVDLCFPFDARHRIDLENLDSDDDTAEARLSTEEREFLRQYRSRDSAWRRIDNEWLSAAGELALHLDRHTNNTSLALAFEIGTLGKGPVLLFPADAQVGNWLSWQDLTWNLGDRTIAIADLLNRTAVYKVGHHGSHNASLARDALGADYGLRLIRDGLVAMIPVDQTASDKLRGWDMPYGKLYEFLRCKTRGNILRSDDVDSSLPVPRLQWKDVPGVAGARWRRSRKKKSEASGGGSLYYDLSLSPAD